MFLKLVKATALTSHFHVDFFAQQAGRLDHQHHDQDQENDGVRKLGRNVGFAQVFDHAEQNAADERAGDRTDAAEHRGDKRLDAGHRAGRGRKGRVGRAQQRPGHRRQRRADRKGQRDGRVDVDAHQLRRAAVLADRQHRVAGRRVVDKQRQRRHDDQAGQDRDHRFDRDGQLAVKQVDRLQAAHHRGEALGVARPQKLRHLLQKIAHADGRDQHGQARGFAQRPVGDRFDHHAQHRAHGHREHDGQQRVPAKAAEGEKDQIAADHDDIAVGKVQHFGNAVYHRIPQGDQRIDAAQADAADQIGQKLHAVYTSQNSGFRAPGPDFHHTIKPAVGQFPRRKMPHKTEKSKKRAAETISVSPLWRFYCLFTASAGSGLALGQHISAVLDDVDLRLLADHAVLIPGLAFAGRAAEGHRGERALERVAHVAHAHVRGDGAVLHALVDRVHAVIGVGSELVRGLVVERGLVVGHKGDGGLVFAVGGERAQHHQAVGHGGVKAVHAQDAVHAVAAEEGGLIADAVGGDQHLAGLLVVDGQEHQVGPGLLALGDLGGQVALVVGREGRLRDNVQPQLGGVGRKGLVDAGRVRVGRVIDDADAGAQAVGADVVGGRNALVGVGEAHLEDVVAGQGHVLRRGGRGQHKQVVGRSLRADGQARVARDGAQQDLHAPVLQVVVGVQRGLGVAGVVLKLELEHGVARGFVDLLHGQFLAVLHGGAVQGVGAGRGADAAQLDGRGGAFGGGGGAAAFSGAFGRGFAFGGAAGGQAQRHGGGQAQADKLLHRYFPP